jgi:hypothetical protein
MRPLLPSLALLLAAAAIAGCGQAPSSTGSFKGAEKAVAQTIEQLESSATSHKPEQICSDVLSRALVDKLKTTGSDCVEEMDKLTGDADDFKLEVKDVTITGTTATARVKARKDGNDNALTTFALVREDGKWRLSNFGAALAQ